MAAFPIPARDLKRTCCRAAARASPSGKKFWPANPAGEWPATRMVKVLYLAHCTREKGVFDAVEGVALANEKFAAEKSRCASS